MHFSTEVTCKQLGKNEWSLFPKLVALLYTSICPMISKKLFLISTTASMIGPFLDCWSKWHRLIFTNNENKSDWNSKKCFGKDNVQQKLFCNGYTHRLMIQNGLVQKRADYFAQSRPVAFTGICSSRSWGWSSFSIAHGIQNGSRTSLFCEHAEQLIFLDEYISVKSEFLFLTLS